MDNSYQQGDLADIVRATATTTTTTDQMLGWQFEPSNLDPYTYSGPLTPDLSTGIPFVDMGLLQGPMSSVPDPVQDNNTNSANYSISTSTSNTSTSNKFEQNHGYGLVSTEMMSVNGSIKGYKDGFIDNTTTTSTGVHHQIPSPSNTGIKRRKSQAKKVVCIPAPAAANNRQTGEVVPSDLWAWRKYGQKPIKGSPYPRGYYRCSSSKGCSARKQVERSRTDPNMLVITYTSEHNHPWPTQRNALAGSTRSQPSKISIGSTTSPNKLSSTVITTNDINNNDNDNNHTNSNVLVKDEFNNDKNTFHESNNNNCGNALMKDENVGVGYDKLVESNISRKDVNNNNVVVNEVLLEDVDTSYRPEMPESSGQQQPTDHDFFADLVGFSGDDPFNLLFTQENKTFNPFGAGAIFDWAPPNNTTTTNNDLDNYSTTYNGQGKGES